MNIIEDLKAAYAAATQGAWKVERNNQDQCTVVVLDGSLRTKVAVTHPTWICEEHGGTTFDNSLLIALMHNALPALIECVEALRQISLCSQNSASSKEECGGIARKALLPFRASGYSLAQIAFELERTALGDGYYGNALRVAKDIHGVSDKDRSLLDRFATGTNGGTDHVALQDLALRIDALAKLQEIKS